MSLIITQGYGIKDLIAVQGYGLAAPAIKISYGVGAPIDELLSPTPAYTFFAESDPAHPGRVGPPTANDSGT